jgi:hypothetical protein
LFFWLPNGENLAKRQKKRKEKLALEVRGGQMI